MKRAIPPFSSARRYAFSRGLVPGIDAFCPQAIADASLVGEKSIALKIPPQKKDTSPCPILAKVICKVEYELLHTSLPLPTKG
jgi:hypothetical protein